MQKLTLISLLSCSLMAGAAAGVPKGLMYVGTLDHKLMVIQERDGEVVGEIALSGIPRSAVLSADKTKLHVVTTKVQVETVDLTTRKVINSFPLSDGRSTPRMLRGAGGRSFSGIAVHPDGRHIFLSLQATVKELDHFRTEPPQFVKVDLVEKKIAKVMPFPKGYDQGFGFAATYKISPDGKLLYVFDEDIVVFDLETFKEVDKIALARPEYPGASPHRLTVSDDPNDAPNEATSVFTSVDPFVHKEMLGLGKIDLTTKKVQYQAIGPAFPMVGFALTPDRKMGYSLMINRTGGNREAEWWVWDIASQKVVKRAPVPARISFRLGMSSDGKTLYLYGAGSTIEFFDSDTLQSKKLLFLNKDTTTNLIVMAGAE